MFQKQEQAFMNPHETTFRHFDEKQKKRAIPIPQKRFFSVGVPVIQRKIYRYESGQWVAVRENSTPDSVDPNEANIPGEEGQYYNGATGKYISAETVMAQAITRAQDRAQHRAEAKVEPRNHAEALSHVSMDSYPKDTPLVVETPTGEALWRRSFFCGPGAMHQEKQPFVFKEDQTLSSKYTALSEAMDGMKPEDRRMSLEAMMRFFKSDEPIERIELPTATPKQTEAVTLTTAILAAENHMTRTSAGGKPERAVIRMLQENDEISFSTVLNTKDGYFVQSQKNGNAVMREALSKPHAPPKRFKNMGHLTEYLSDSSDKEPSGEESSVSMVEESPAEEPPVSMIEEPPADMLEEVAEDFELPPFWGPNEAFSQDPSRQSWVGLPELALGTGPAADISEADIPKVEELLVRYVILRSTKDLSNEDPDLLEYLYENVYKMMDNLDEIAPEAVDDLENFVHRYWSA